MLEKYHETFLDTVPFKTIATFTLFQAAYLLLCFGLTWIPIAGVLFPLLIMLLVPVRQYLLPKFFKRAHLQDLDAAEYEEAPATAFNMSFEASYFNPFLNSSAYLLKVLYWITDADALYSWQDQDVQARINNIDSGEILDEVITRSRGEIRRTQSPKASSLTPTSSLEAIKPAYSPRLTQRVYSPRLNELRGERSPRLTGQGLETVQTPSPCLNELKGEQSNGQGLETRKTPSPGPSVLGQSSPGSSSYKT